MLILETRPAQTLLALHYRPPMAHFAVTHRIRSPIVIHSWLKEQTNYSQQTKKRSGCVSKTKRKEHQLFPKKWLARYHWSWTQFTESDGSMSCQLCKQQGKCCVCVDGTRNFRLKTVTDHKTSKDHLHAVAAWSSDQRSIKGAVDKEMEKKRDAISLALQTFYWFATGELPNAKFKSLLNFLRTQGMSNATYLLR